MEKSNSRKWFKLDVTVGDIVREVSLRVPPPKKAQRKKPVQRTENISSEPLPNLIDLIHPKLVTELAVHNRKIAEVQDWLNVNVLQKKKIPVLVLTGPTGAGKTATLRVLCESMQIEVKEWVNQVHTYDEDFLGPGQIELFRTFLLETSRYRPLISNKPYHIALVEDFPNAVVHNPSTFEEILELLFERGIYPVVFICTETKDSSLNLDLKLFPQTTKEKYGIPTISFNPVNATLIKAALKRASTIIQEKHKDLYQIPPQDALNTIANSAMGDVRAALNYFNFACLKGTENLPVDVEIVLGTKRKRNTKNQGVLSSMNKDESIGLLHGVGRVLYPKRINATWKFEHSPESIIEQFSTMPSLFISFLQENYLRFFGNLNNVKDAADLLSCSELFMSQWTEKEIMVIYALWVTVLGLMVKNEEVVSKWNPIQGPKQNKLKKHAKDFTKIDPVDLSYENIIKQTSSNNRFNL